MRNAIWPRISNTASYNGVLTNKILRLGKTSQSFSIKGGYIVNIDLTEEDLNILLKSGSNCLNTCEEGGPGRECPDCQRLQHVMAKLKAGVS